MAATGGEHDHDKTKMMALIMTMRWGFIDWKKIFT